MVVRSTGARQSPTLGSASPLACDGTVPPLAGSDPDDPEPPEPPDPDGEPITTWLDDEHPARSATPTAATASQPPTRCPTPIATRQ
jgi:hypothetical protein